MFVWYLVLVQAMGGFDRPLADDPRVQFDVQYAYYTVSGPSFRDAHNETFARQLRHGGVASAQPVTEFDFTVQMQDGACQLVDFNIRVDITLTYPHWHEYETRSAQSRQRWDHYVARLEAHENEHVALTADSVERLRRGLLEVESGRNCAALQAEISRVFQQENRRHERSQQDYDRVTDHGLDARAQDRWMARRAARR